MGGCGVRHEEHRLAAAPAGSGLHGEGTCQVEVADKLDYFPSQLPVARASEGVELGIHPIGCNNTCTFCIVPTTRGKEHDRRPGDILAEIRRCVDEGAKEVTLLGQNVNSFGYGIGDRYAFSSCCGPAETSRDWSVCVSRRLIRRRSPTT